MTALKYVGPERVPKVEVETPEERLEFVLYANPYWDAPRPLSASRVAFKTAEVAPTAVAMSVVTWGATE